LLTEKVSINFKLRKILLFLYHKTSTDMNEGLKQIIFKKLKKDLSKVEVIDDDKSIWFIDRTNKYWYLEFRKSGTLWWRYEFFKNFFVLFSLEREDYESLISEWVESILKGKVVSSTDIIDPQKLTVESILKSKVVSSYRGVQNHPYSLESILKNEGIQMEETDDRKILSLRPGVRECRMKIKKISKNLPSSQK
jgi:hypothetical protein